MSDSLLKANRIVVKKDNKRVIDSNQVVSERIRILSEILESQAAEGVYSEEFADGFVEGLDADQVEQLLQDSDDGFEEGFAPVSKAPSVDVQQIIDDANSQAEEILANARMEAENIIAGASAEAEELKSQAFDEGHQQGYGAGYDEGLAKAYAMQQELEQKSQMLTDDYERKVSELEPLFVETLTDIYSHVLGVNLADQKEVIIYLLKDAIRNIDGSRNFFVHVSKDDFPDVSSAKDVLSQGLGSNVNIEIIEDMTLKQSECFVEAESGIFDCGLGIELELLKKELVLLSYQKEN